jgi:glucose-1-phosphate cytidylyltransferase
VPSAMLNMPSMQAVILAGGLGSRLAEETQSRPKPMVEIGGKPILWHIMKIYSSHGVNDFIICCGYKGYVIKEFFSNYHLHCSDVTFNMQTGSLSVHSTKSEPWNVTLVDTGELTQTAGRLSRIQHLILNENFFFTYGDGVSDVDIRSLYDFHVSSGKQVTMTAVRPPGRYGVLSIDNDVVTRFQEKPEGTTSWINGGFFVVNKSVMGLIKDDSVSWEDSTLKQLSLDSQLAAYKHNGFWQSMDTLRDRNYLETLWSASAPWRSWN